MKAAVLFDHFGPYHIARLSAASGVLELLGVEFGGRSRDYPWKRVSIDRRFRAVTLFPDRTSGEVDRPTFERKLDSELRSYAPDVVAIPGWSGRGALTALRWCSSTGTPAVLMSESTVHDARRLLWKERIKRRIVRLASAALVGGRSNADYLAQLGFPAERIFKGYDAVDNEYFSRASALVPPCGASGRADSDAVHVVGGETPALSTIRGRYFLASARFIEKKNLDRLLLAYARYRELALSRADSANCLDAAAPAESRSDVASTGEPWKLIVLGDGPLRTELHDVRRKLAMEGSVYFPGFMQYAELPAYYGCAGAFVHASTSEQWGLVVNEAMASGLPVLVSTRCGCAPDLVRESVNGFTFDPTDVERLARLMLTMARLPRNGGPQQLTLESMGQASRRIISEWGPDRFARGLRDAAACAARTGNAGTRLFDGALLRALVLR